MEAAQFFLTRFTLPSINLMITAAVAMYRVLLFFFCSPSSLSGESVFSVKVRNCDWNRLGCQSDRTDVTIIIQKQILYKFACASHPPLADAIIFREKQSL